MAEQQSNVAVLGGGSFGTALASIAADNGANVRQWLRDEALVAQINREHRNGRYLPDYAINPAVTASTDLKSVLTGADCHPVKSVSQRGASGQALALARTNPGQYHQRD